MFYSLLQGNRHYRFAASRLPTHKLVDGDSACSVTWQSTEVKRQFLLQVATYSRSYTWLSIRAKNKAEQHKKKSAWSKLPRPGRRNVVQAAESQSAWTLLTAGPPAPSTHCATGWRKKGKGHAPPSRGRMASHGFLVTLASENDSVTHKHRGTCSSTCYDKQSLQKATLAETHRVLETTSPGSLCSAQHHRVCSSGRFRGTSLADRCTARQRIHKARPRSAASAREEPERFLQSPVSRCAARRAAATLDGAPAPPAAPPNTPASGNTARALPRVPPGHPRHRRQPRPPTSSAPSRAGRRLSTALRPPAAVRSGTGAGASQTAVPPGARTGREQARPGPRRRPPPAAPAQQQAAAGTAPARPGRSRCAALPRHGGAGGHRRDTPPHTPPRAGGGGGRPERVPPPRGAGRGRPRRERYLHRQHRLASWPPRPPGRGEPISPPRSAPRQTPTGIQGGPGAAAAPHEANGRGASEEPGSRRGAGAWRGGAWQGL